MKSALFWESLVAENVFLFSGNGAFCGNGGDTSGAGTGELWESLTTKQRKQIATLKGFPTVGEFRAYLQTIAPSYDDISPTNLKFVWQTWNLQSKKGKKELALSYGYDSVAAFEEWISAYCTQAHSSEQDGDEKYAAMTK